MEAAEDIISFAEMAVVQSDKPLAEKTQSNDEGSPLKKLYTEAKRCLFVKGIGYDFEEREELRNFADDLNDDFDGVEFEGGMNIARISSKIGLSDQHHSQVEFVIEKKADDEFEVTRKMPIKIAKGNHKATIEHDENTDSESNSLHNVSTVETVVASSSGLTDKLGAIKRFFDRIAPLVEKHADTTAHEPTDHLDRVIEDPEYQGLLNSGLYPLQVGSDGQSLTL
jgi:hypothetical protein